MDINFADWVYYDPASTTGLRWKKNYESTRTSIVPNRVGNPAGCQYWNKYWVSGIKGKYYKNHRIILILNGVDLKPTDFVDHIDGNPANNLLENLRVTDNKTNCQNAKMRSNNKTGVNGVNWIAKLDRKGTYRTHYAVATWSTIDCKVRSKCFSVKKLGVIPAFAEAVKFRQKMLDELISMGAGYTERHGT